MYGDENASSKNFRYHLMFCKMSVNGNLGEDLVLDERVLGADLLCVQGGVEGLLCFDARSANTMSDVMKSPKTSHIIDNTTQLNLFLFS